MRPAYHSPGPVGYGAPGSGAIGGPSLGNGNAFLGIDPYDNPVHASHGWQEADSAGLQSMQ